MMCAARVAQGVIIRGSAALALLVLGLGVAAPGSSLAQTVNADSLRVEPLTPGWSGDVSGSFSMTRGNLEILDVGGAGRIQHQKVQAGPASTRGQSSMPYLDHRIFTTLNVRYAKSGDSAFLNQAFMHSRWTKMWHPMLGSDAFIQFSFNEFWRLKARGVAGGGARVTLVHMPELMIWGGVAYMLEYENIRVAPGAPDPPETIHHRMTSSWVMRGDPLQGRLLFQSTTYYQPNLERAGDYRFLEEVEVLARVTNRLALGTTLSVMFDSEPPTQVKSTDWRLATTIRLTL